MFEKKRAAADNSLKNGVKVLTELQTSHAAEIIKKFAEIDETDDAAEKIVKLRAVKAYINKTEAAIDDAVTNLATNHVFNFRSVSDKFKDSLGAGFFIEEPKYKRLQLQMIGLFKEQAETDGFLSDMNDLKTVAESKLVAAVKSCDLGDISGSPYFAEAYKIHEPLRDRFTAAAAARAALGDSQRATMGEKAGGEKAPEAKEPAADQAETPAEAAPASKPERRIHNYDNLRQAGRNLKQDGKPK